MVLVSVTLLQSTQQSLILTESIIFTLYGRTGQSGHNAQRVFKEVDISQWGKKSKKNRPPQI